MQTVESEQEANTIVSVMKKGYLLADRVLRPAMVVVAKAADAEWKHRCTQFIKKTLLRRQ